MAFVERPGLKGKVFVPETCKNPSKKHKCRECFVCQGCGEDRCRICKRQPPKIACHLDS